LGRFLGNKDNNYKYIALNTLQEVAKLDLNSVQKHKNTILDCLKDSDISIKRRALDLVYIIVNTTNIKQIIKECLNFLLIAEGDLKLELTFKVSLFDFTFDRLHKHLISIPQVSNGKSIHSSKCFACQEISFLKKQLQISST